VGCFVIDGDPIYDIEGIPQEKGVELSSSKEHSSYMYIQMVCSLAMK
jgi:hypothetical protein